MPANDRCPNCGAQRPSTAPAGLCPQCLLRLGLGADLSNDRGDSRTTPRGVGEPAASVLDVLTVTAGPLPQVALHDTAPEDGLAPLERPSSPELPDPADRPARLQLFGEIGRGGMVAILRARDPDLGREVAVKVLLAGHRDRPELVRRFVEEAQIGGQLQHPGVVPVYELGAFGDARPYFAMKLVKGRTLAALLEARSSPAADLARFLGIFEHVCQTVAYAHARGVIHRDLKPSNVMAGSFGEVQLMDWGLAKVLPRGGAADDAAAGDRPDQEAVIATDRSGSGGDPSLAGSVMGTPAYMAPEQARGDIERLDERCDVFALGSILCEVLTGEPAYTGPSSAEIQRLAARADTADALARLDGCGAEAELIALAKDCLAVEPEDRPHDAGLVAGRMTAYLTGVQARVQEAERERAVAVARAFEERRRRKLQLGLAASVLAFTILGGMSTMYYLQQRHARAAAIDRIVGQAVTLRDQALAHADDLARWQVAMAAVQQAEGVLGGADAAARRRLAALRDEVRVGADAAERDWALLDRLVDIRSAKTDDPEGSATDAAYADAFVEAGLDPSASPPAEAVAKIKARPPAVAMSLAAALDDWASVRRSRNDWAGAKRLTEVTQAIDPDPWRNDLRTALGQTDKQPRLAALRALATTARFDELGAVNLELLGKALAFAGDPAGAESVLRRAQRRYPGDVWVSYDLGRVLEDLNRRDDAIRFYTAARAVRPETAHELAHALEARGESDEAIAVFRDLVVLRPKSDRHLGCLGTALQDRGRSDEAAPVLDQAVATLRELIRLKPDFHPAYVSLGSTLKRQGKLDEAIAAYRAAIRLKPEDATAHNMLGIALDAQGKPHEAITAYRETLRIKPDHALALINLGNARIGQGKLDEAIPAYREAIRLKPNSAEAHSNLGFALKVQGKLDDAVASCREAIRLKPDFAGAYINLGTALLDQGKLDEAVAAYRNAIRLKPDDAAPHSGLGNVLRLQGRLKEAVAACREAIRLKPDFAGAHNNLGAALGMQDKLDEALAEFREAIRLKPDDAGAHNNLGAARGRQGKLDEALTEFREAIRLKPDYFDARNNLINTLRRLGKLAEAVAALREATRLEPNNASAFYQLGNSLKAQGNLDEAVAAFREATRLEPKMRVVKIID